MASASSEVKLPDLPPLQSIYAGKFKDWSPNLRPAGKLTASGDTVQICMKPQKRPESPDVIRRFRATFMPDASKRRVFYGKAHDPHLQWAEAMRHGVNTMPSLTAGELANPRPLSMFQNRMKEKRESCYASHQKAPLGISHDQTPGLPPKLDPLQFTFGIPTELDAGAGGLINPNRDYAEVMNDGREFHDLYIRSHRDFDVGEKIKRGYTMSSFKPSTRYGIPTPHSNDGRHTKHTLKWIYETELEKGAKIVNKRVDDFRERTQPQLGRVHDPIKDTMNVPPDHTFGILLKPDEYGAGDLIHNRAAGTFLRSYDQIRGIVAATRQHLKKMNYHNFDSMLHAFKYYDKSGTGKINIHDLRTVCHEMNLPVDDHVLVHLMDACDADKDGQINYLEFANFLNWKDKMPSGFAPFPVDETGDAAEELRQAGQEEKRLVKDGDLIPKTPQNHDSTPRRLQMHIDKMAGDPRTSASVINAVVGGYSTKDYRTYGVPTIRSDLHAPTIRRIDDRTNYGDESAMHGLMNPNKYAQRGVYEHDFLLPRPKEEIKQIFFNIGVFMKGDDFDKAYETAAKNHPKGHVSIESFRTVLDDLHAYQLLEGTSKFSI